MAPKRLSKSPAKTKPTPAEEPAAEKPSKSPARSKSPAKAKPTAAKNGASAPPPAAEVAKPATTPTPVAKPVAAPPPPKPPPKPKMLIPLAVFGVVLAIGFVLAQSFATPPPKITKVSAKAFDGKSLKGKSNALVIFTETDYCEACKTLKGVTSGTPFRKMAHGWKAKGFKVATIDCMKHYETCERFGVAGDDPSATGYPYIIHFKAGEEVGPYDGERTLEGFSAWYEKKAAAGEL